MDCRRTFVEHRGVGMESPAQASMKIYGADEFLQRETEIWRVLSTGDAEADARLLSEDFLGVYGSGFAGKSDHVNPLRAGPTVRRFSLSEARIMTLAEGVVLLSYRADWVRAASSDPDAVETMYVSSIWRRAGAGWRNIFSQDTNAEAQDPTVKHRQANPIANVPEMPSKP
jgi:hypothetical protein